MRPLLLGLLAGLVAILGGALAGFETAWSCSCGPSCDEIIPSADVIVEGRITDWAALDEPGLGTFSAIEVTIDVVRVYRGPATDPLHAWDGASLDTNTPDGSVRGWYGSSGGCGSFDEDPRGRYIVAALNYDDRGRLRLNRLATLYLGDEPEGEAYDMALAYLASTGVGAPVAGTGLRDVRETHHWATLLGLALAVFGAGAFVADLRRRRS